MAKDAWMPLWIGDYLSDTQHLTTEQHGAYLLLLMAVWRQGELPNDPKILAKITGLSPHKWKKNAQIILKFFENNSQKISHKRVDSERVRSTARQSQATEKARKAANQRWGSWPDMTDAPSNANHNHSNRGPNPGTVITNPELNDVEIWGDDS